LPIDFLLDFFSLADRTASTLHERWKRKETPALRVELLSRWIFEMHPDRVEREGGKSKEELSGTCRFEGPKPETRTGTANIETRVRRNIVPYSRI
jgi:hypothetical protein